VRYTLPRLFTVLSLLAAPLVSPAQEFPPPEEASRLHLGEEPPAVGPILAVGIGWGGAFTLDDTKDGNLAERFKAGRWLHAMAGVRIESVGLVGIYRQGTPGVAAGACPGGHCSAESTQTGVIAMFCANGGRPGPLFNLGLGWWTDKTEIQRAGGLVKRMEGWALLEYLSVDFPVGPPTSRFRLGGYGLLAVTNWDKEITPVGSTTIGSTVAQPTWAELGVRVSFF
jgi:hypothetical protein